MADVMTADIPWNPRVPVVTLPLVPILSSPPPIPSRPTRRRSAKGSRCCPGGGRRCCRLGGRPTLAPPSRLITPPPLHAEGGPRDCRRGGAPPRPRRRPCITPTPLRCRPYRLIPSRQHPIAAPLMGSLSTTQQATASSKAVSGTILLDGTLCSLPPEGQTCFHTPWIIAAGPSRALTGHPMLR